MPKRQTLKLLIIHKKEKYSPPNIFTYRDIPGKNVNFAPDFEKSNVKFHFIIYQFINSFMSNFYV